MKVPIDLLDEHHELLSFDTAREDEWQWVEVEIDGGSARVQVPRVCDAGVERVLRADVAGNLLYLIGEVGHDYDGWGRIGCLVVARDVGDGVWRAVVFHALYPFSQTRLV